MYPDKGWRDAVQRPLAEYGEFVLVKTTSYAKGMDLLMEMRKVDYDNLGAPKGFEYYRDICEIVDRFDH